MGTKNPNEIEGGNRKMMQPEKKLPDWNDVLEAFEKIPGYPDFLVPVKDILLLFLLRWIREYSHPEMKMKCLKKYGVVPPVKYSYKDYNNTLWGEYWRRHDVNVKERRAKLERETQDWHESIALARALDLLSGQMGTVPEVKDFLYKLKVRFWHINEDPGSILDTIFIHSGTKYRCVLVWFVRWQYAARHYFPYKESSCYSIVCPPLENWKKKWNLRDWKERADGCHPSIRSGELNVFVLYAMQSSRPLKQADFLGILAYERLDFLEYLLADLPAKKLPYSMIDIIQLILETQKDAFALKVLQLIERVHPGLLASISDPHGGNLLWHFICKPARPDLDKSGAILLTPLQRFLYSLCDHAKPNCDGISFDDMCRYYPSEIIRA